MQTILGAGGAIGIQLAKALTAYTDHIRLVSRNPVKVNPTDELFAADLLDPKALAEAIAGSEIVYVTVGFPYSYKVWKANWPTFIKNLLAICQKAQCKLVFFDNVYMYDPQHLHAMTEATPINPPSRKGEVRATIAKMITDSVQAGAIEALIARSADFYGPSIKGTSILTETVFQPLFNNKTASWFASTQFQHSFTYTPDAGKATALLGNSANAYGQIWHLPTASNPMTGKEWIEAIAAEMKVKPKFRVVSKSMLRLIGMFVPIMKESVEMIYQYDRDYVFDSSKFEDAFNFSPTPYTDGIKQIMAADYQV